LQDRAQCSEEDDVEEVRPLDQERERVTHGPQIGSNVDGVRNQQQTDDAVKEPARVVLPDVSGNALPGRAPDLRADLLDRHHQRIAEQHGP